MNFLNFIKSNACMHVCACKIFLHFQPGYASGPMGIHFLSKSTHMAFFGWYFFGYVSVLTGILFLSKTETELPSLALCEVYIGIVQKFGFFQTVSSYISGLTGLWFRWKINRKQRAFFLSGLLKDLIEIVGKVGKSFKNYLLLAFLDVFQLQV